MLKKFFVLFFSVLSINSLHAQEKLRLADAVSIALKNNYSILVSKNEAEMDANNNTTGNAGMLPSLDATASGTKSVNATKQNYSTGQEVNKGAVPSRNLAAGVALNWMIFDGFKMFATKGRLEELQSKGEISLKIQIENTIEQVVDGYFNVVKNRDLLAADQDAINIYKERVRISETKFNIGSASKLELLQAKVDMNAQLSAELKDKTALNNSKNNLNQLLARAIDTDFDATDSIMITYRPALDDLKKTITTQNNTLLSAQKDLNIASYSVKEIESQRYPRIGIGAGYNYSRVNNSAGLILLNQNAGPNYGFTVSWNLFNGFVVNNQIKNAKLDYQNSELRLNDAKSQIESQLLQAFNTFRDALEAVKLEEENLVLAKENLSVALERFRIGNSTPLELQEAQKSLVDAENRTLSARYDAKVAETELMRLNGELVK